MNLSILALVSKVDEEPIEGVVILLFDEMSPKESYEKISGSSLRHFLKPDGADLTSSWERTESY